MRSALSGSRRPLSAGLPDAERAMAGEATERFLSEVRAFARDDITRDAPAWARGEVPDPAIFARAAEIGLMRIEVPTAFGGLGLGFRAKVEACAIIASVDFGLAMSWSTRITWRSGLLSLHRRMSPGACCPIFWPERPAPAPLSRTGHRLGCRGHAMPRRKKSPAAGCWRARKPGS